ncbi:MAG: DUF5995 family protein [Dehalococcoidia bacterium]
MPAHTIDEVIGQLDRIIATCREEGSRLGFFPALYRKVTLQVKEGIIAGRFEDGPRMERFDVIFASRYLEAWESFRQGEGCSRAWEAAFQAAASRRLLVLQHLLLGMNAHINLDLGIAAAHTCPGEQLASLKRDFDEITNLLAELLDQVQREVGTVSPALGLLDRVGGGKDEAVANFSMDRAREAAWQAAEKLAPLPPAEQQPEIERLDHWVTAFSYVLRPRWGLLGLVTLIIRLFEIKDVRRTIDILL